MWHSHLWTSNCYTATMKPEITKRGMDNKLLCSLAKYALHVLVCSIKYTANTHLDDSSHLPLSSSMIHMTYIMHNSANALVHTIIQSYALVHTIIHMHAIAFSHTRIIYEATCSSAQKYSDYVLFCSLFIRDFKSTLVILFTATGLYWIQKTVYTKFSLTWWFNNNKFSMA